MSVSMSGKAEHKFLATLHHVSFTANNMQAKNSKIQVLQSRFFVIKISQEYFNIFFEPTDQVKFIFMQ